MGKFVAIHGSDLLMVEKWYTVLLFEFCLPCVLCFVMPSRQYFRAVHTLNNFVNIITMHTD
ncbi:MAG: hypothetical protein CMN10_02360 [Roseobacter sp.]|nr:hypothetical protein [Roseobacter sp.]